MTVDRHEEAFARQAERFDRHCATLEEHTSALKEHTRMLGHQVDAMRSAYADIKLLVEKVDRKTDALLGAFSDLATEIRGWRADQDTSG